MSMFVLLGLCCAGGGIFLLVILFVRAFILRWACKIVGVREPDYGQAMLIVFVTVLVNGLINTGLNYVVTGGMPKNTQPTQLTFDDVRPQLLMYLIELPLNLVLSAGIISSMLENVGFGKGFLIALLEGLIGLAIVAVLVFFIVAMVLLFKPGPMPRGDGHALQVSCSAVVQCVRSLHVF
jgi:hypothetical protein